MKRHSRATLALPLAILMSGAVIPLVVSGGGRAPTPPADATELRYAGLTAREWCARATRALDEGEYNLAIRYLKTAEKVEPGRQYDHLLACARRERRRAGDVARSRDRLLGGGPDALELDAFGVVVSGHRTTVVLPGESLWTIAEGLVAAERWLPSDAIGAGDREVYGTWDKLTALNGMRELEVGEVVLLPIPDEEAAAISSANAVELQLMAEASAALDAGNVDAAAKLRERVSGAFALGLDALGALDERLRDARAGRMVESARALIAEADSLPRPTRHGELVGALREARRLLTVAGGTPGVVAGTDLERADALLAQAQRYSVGEDGVIAATKPAGVAYTDFARSTVEWFLKRELRRSGKEYPYHDQKTADEIAWAAYLIRASELAEREGVDFAGLLTSDVAEAHVRLPNPGEYFTGAAD